MFHGVLTLLTRALKADAKLRRSHAFRIGSTLLILLFLIVAHATSGGVGAPGLRFFTLISWLNLALITLAGTSFFATAITEEKEEGTLGLLQLAGISTMGLLLGMSTARLIAALLVFLVQLPFALLAVSLGGVTARQIIAVDAALAAYMVMLANVAMLASVVSRRSASASAGMVLFLLVLLPFVHFGDYAVETLVAANYLQADSRFVMAGEAVFNFFQEISIVTSIADVLEVDHDAASMTGQVVLHLTTAVLAFVLSWLVFERFTRYSDGAVPSRGVLPKVNSRWGLFVERPWRRPLIWKDYHFLTGGHTLALAKLIGYPLLFAATYYWRDMLHQVTGLSFPQLSRQLMFVLIGCGMCLYASRLFHEEMKWGTLPNLTMLPQSIASIAWEKVAGCLLGLLPDLVVLCGLHAVIWHHVAAQNLSGDELNSTAVVFGFLTFFKTSLLGDLSNPGVWLILMQLMVLLHLTVLCSLIVKWGGLATAVAIQLILNALLVGPTSAVVAGLTAAYGGDEVAIAPIVYTGCLLAVVLQFLIGLRVRRVAGQ